MRKQTEVPAGPTALLTVEQVADACAVSPRTVRRWIDDDELLAHRLGRLVRISPHDLEDFLRRHRGPR